MAFGFRAVSVSLLAITFLLVLEEWASKPTCTNPQPTNNNDNLKVMIVADLLLSASSSSLLFRDYYISKFFQKSFDTLRPDLLLVLGDVSARGSGLTRPKWLALLRRFRRVLGPFVGLPFHVVLGDRDVGECGEVDADRVSWVADQFPGLDSAACAAFEIGDVGFVTLNAVALLCGNCALRFEVERVVERESVDLRTSGSDGFGSGPVLLLHLPLDRTTDRDYAGFRRPSNSFTQGLNVLPKIREVDGGGIYDVLHTLPLNVSEYILQALKPRIIFSAHSYEFSDYVHRDGTREITVPAMSWNSRDDPGFVIATFQKAGRAVNISYCSLARESHILIVYISIFFLFCLVCLKG